MNLPLALLQSLQGVAGFDEKAFSAVHESGEQVTSIRLNPAKKIAAIEQQRNEPLAKPADDPMQVPGFMSPVPWSSEGYYLLNRPSFTFDPLFHAGTYYVQEASSMFLEQALKQTTDLTAPLRVLDLCAAPGGKSTLLQSLISKESLLVSNEVIKSRAAVLEENIIKWGSANVVVTNNDPAHFSRLENYFDVIVIDAPCSGSGLFRRDAAAINEWSTNNVQHCSQRQQRIITDVWPALKQNGVLIYSTCSYSTGEDEAILDWMLDGLMATSKRLVIQPEWGITESVSAKHNAYGYRFYPDKTKGEGFFIAAMVKESGGVFTGITAGKAALEQLAVKDATIVNPWLSEDASLVFFKQKEAIIALPSFLQKEIPVLQSALYIKKAGVTAGKIAGKDFIPDHQLAVSSLCNKSVTTIALNRQEAIAYLRKEEVNAPTTHRGWAAVSYAGHNLGWVKALPNRMNNYYPKEWRITRQAP
ncbi:MAG: RNA methyltransferase [Chitinophagaceae bacterium]